MLCRACTAHAEYLAANGWNGHTDPHEQDPRKRKASPEGAAVAGTSIIMKVAPAASLRTHYVTFFHRVGMMHPRLERVGINETIPSMSVIDVYNGRLKGEAGAVRHATPRFCPADGAERVPTGSASEFPDEPVLNLASRGFPLMVFFPEAGGEVTAFRGSLHRGTVGRNEVPTLPVAPDGRGIAGIVPARRLDGKTDYVARFSWQRGGEAHAHVIRFRTQ
jgi:hypothetical protein